MTGEPTAAVLDPALIARIQRGSQAAAVELVALFEEHTSAELEILRGAIGSGDASTMRAVSHGLAGSAATIGALRMALGCRELSTAAAAGRTAGAAVLLAEVERSFDAVREALRTLLSPPAGLP